MKAIQKVCFCIGVIILLAANAQAGRWITQDPIGFMERDPRPTIPGASVPASSDYQQQLNLYRFVDNSPLNYIDPYGLALFPPNFIGPLQSGDSRIPYPPSNISGGP